MLQIKIQFINLLKIVFVGTASAGKVVCNRKRLAYSKLAIWTKRRSTVALLTLFMWLSLTLLTKILLLSCLVSITYIIYLDHQRLYFFQNLNDLKLNIVSSYIAQIYSLV